MPRPAENQRKYLRPMADRALRIWFGPTYSQMDIQDRALLADDVAGIMIEEELLPSMPNHGGVMAAVMLLDLRIYPAVLQRYVDSLSPEGEEDKWY